MTRQLVFLDTETTGFDDDPDAQLVELTYATLGSEPVTLWFGITEVPANIDELIGFTKRGISGRQSDWHQIVEFLQISDGATMVAANPAFDKSFLQRSGLWQFHHRMLDIEAYAMGVLNLDYVPGMNDLYKLLDLDNQPDHTSRGDVLALRESYVLLKAIASLRDRHGAPKLNA